MYGGGPKNRQLTLVEDLIPYRSNHAFISVFRYMQTEELKGRQLECHRVSLIQLDQSDEYYK